MTVSNGKSAADVLTDFVDKCVANLEAGDYNEAKRRWDIDVTEALAALEEIMVAAKPDLLSEDTDQYNESHRYAEATGFNLGVSTYEQNIRQAFSNGGGE